jgi:tripartite-type tricarboxylate transporter receptor subunit TctC
MEEAGFPNVEAVAWLAIAGPANMPADIADLLTTKISEIVARPDVRQKFERTGVQPVAWTRAKTDASIRKEVAKWSDIIRQAKIGAN